MEHGPPILGFGADYRTVNTYPGCACDVPGVFYSFSFEPFPGSSLFPPQKEIQRYLHDVAENHGVAQHIVYNTFFHGAKWNEDSNTWTLSLENLQTGRDFEETVDLLFMALGGLVTPNKCTISGVETFKGDIFHSAQWNHAVSLGGKNVIVVGNGCSASQLIPNILTETKSITQFIRTPQWYLKSPNYVYPEWVKALFKYVPGAVKAWRFVCRFPKGC